MYDYDLYDYSAGISSISTIGRGPLIALGLVSLILIVSLWKIYKKAGKPGWASIVPIYNVIVLLQMSGLPLWYLVLYIIPFVNIFAIFKTYIELAHKFGKSTGFGVSTVFFGVICFPILAFSESAEYK